MDDKVLYRFEHTVLPLLFLCHEEGCGSVVNHFGTYAERFCLSFASEDFATKRVGNTDPEWKYIKPFLGKGDRAVVFRFPFFPHEQYIGLAPFGFFVYKKGFAERRYFLLEMFRFESGLDKPLWYSMVEYRLVGMEDGDVLLSRRAHRRSVRFGLGDSKRR